MGTRVDNPSRCAVWRAHSRNLRCKKRWNLFFTVGSDDEDNSDDDSKSAYNVSTEEDVDSVDGGEQDDVALAADTSDDF